jgi:hypothetical protein
LFAGDHGHSQGQEFAHWWPRMVTRRLMVRNVLKVETLCSRCCAARPRALILRRKGDKGTVRSIVLKVPTDRLRC